MPNLGNTWDKLHGSDESHTASSTTGEPRLSASLFAVRPISILLCHIAVWYSASRSSFGKNIAPYLSRVLSSHNLYVAARIYRTRRRNSLALITQLAFDGSKPSSLVGNYYSSEFVDISACAERIVRGGLISASRKSILRLTSQTCAAGILSVSWSHNTMLLEK